MTPLEKMYRDNRAKLLRTIAHKGHSLTDAEDALNEAVCKLLARNIELNIKLIYVTAVNTASDWRKTMGTRHRLNQLLEAVDPFDSGPEKLWLDRQTQQHYQVALAALAKHYPRWYQAYSLRTQDELQFDEIAKRLGFSVRMAQRYIEYCVQYCRKHISDNELKG